MECSACGDVNRNGSRFCALCGTPFSSNCASCDAELRPDARFCDRCGTPVGQRAVIDSPAPDDEAVRKTVTVLFADVVGSTAFSEAVDAESARTVMAGYHSMAQRVIDRHAGHLEKFIGDGVMAVFGIPEVAEDDALRAVRSGLDLQREFAPIAAEISSTYGTALTLRVGVNTGEIVIADEDADLVGDVLNTAARLEGACEPGDVLVGEDTWRLTRSSASYEVLNEISLKGKQLPVATFRVLEANESDDFQTPFVGREAELDKLTVGFDAATASGRARLISVIGSPGVGKTRLAAELRERTAAYSRSFDLRVDRAGTSTFAPVGELLRETVGLDDGLAADQTLGRIREFVSDASTDSDRLVELLGTFVGAAPPRSTEESFWATRRLLEILGSRSSVIVVIDDIQWAEPLFLDLLEHLVEWVEAPILLVGLARPELREIRPALSEPSRRVSDVISIEGLDAAATEALAARILDTDVLPPDLVDLLPEATQGNPLFVREVVRMLVDDNVITRTPEGWLMAIDREAVEVPPTIQSLLAARVERMPDDERSFIEMASVVGSEFARGAVEDLMPPSNAGETDRLLERLRRKELVEPTGSYWGDEPMLRFHHVLIRDAAYRRILKQRRIDLHLQVAQWTLDTAERLAAEHEIPIAYHYERAHEYLAQLGRADERRTSVGELAAGLLNTAAERALEQDDLDAAGGLARRALKVLDPDSEARRNVVLLGCEALISAGDIGASEALMAELESMAEGDERLAAWFDAFAGHVAVLKSPDELILAEASVAAAAETLHRLGDPAGVAKARLVRALILFSLGRVAESETELDQALIAARSANDRRRISAVLGAAPIAALWGPSPVARAGGRCLDIIRLLRITSASPMVEATSIRCQGVLEAMRGRYDQARALLARSRDTATELGLRQGVLETAEFSGLVELFAGDAAAAEAHLTEAYEGLAEMGAMASAGRVGALLAKSALLQGRLEDAEAFATDSDALAGQALQIAIGSRAVLAELAAHRGRYVEALALAHDAVSIASSTDLLIDHAVAAASLMTVQRMSGDAVAAEASSDEAARLFEAKGADFTQRSTEPSSIDSSGPSADAEVGVHNTSEEPDSLENPTDAEEARRRFDELTPAGGSSASGTSLRLWRTLFDQPNVDVVLDLFAQDAVVEDHRSTIGWATSVEAVVTFFESYARSHQFLWATDLLGTHGPNVVTSLARAAADDVGFESQWLEVLEVDSDGRVIFFSLFDATDFPAAHDSALSRYIGGVDGSHRRILEVVRELANRASESPEAMESLLHDDLIVENHAQLSWEPSVGKAAFIERVSSLGGGGIQSIAEVLAVCPTAALVNRHLRTTNPETLIERLCIIAADTSAGVVTSIHDFERDDLDAARRRFDELSRTNPAVAANRAPYEPATNSAASALVAVWRACLDQHDVDALFELHRPDSAITDSRPLVGWIDGRDSIRNWIAEFASRHDFEWEDRALAIRGDRLAVTRTTARTRGSTFTSRWINLVELDERGLFSSHTICAEDDLASAMAELNKRFVAGAGQPHSAILQGWWMFGRLIAGDSTIDPNSVLGEEILIVNHRFPRGVQTRQHFLEVFVPALSEIDGSGIAWTSEFHRLTPSGLVATLSSTRATSDGFASGRDYIAVVGFDGRLLTSCDTYEADDLATALRRFDELRVAASADNAAVSAVRTVYTDLFDNNDADSAFGCYHDDTVTDDRRSLVGSDHDLPMLRAAFPSTDGVGRPISSTYQWSVSPIAVRGDRLALLRGSWQESEARWPTDLLEVVEINHSGKIVYAGIYDVASLNDALDGLSERYFAGEGAEFTEVIRTVKDAALAFDSGDPELIGRLLAPGYELVDHREITRGATGAQVVSEASAEGHTFMPRFERVNNRGVLGPMLRVATSEDGFAAEWSNLILHVVEGGRLQRSETFAEDDIEAALARFEELTAEPGNRSSHMAREQIRAIAENDTEAIRRLYSEDIDVDDYRTMRQAAGLGLDYVIGGAGDFFEMGGEASHETLAWRGDKLHLGRVRFTYPDGLVSTSLLVSALGDEDRLARLAYFDEHDLRGAQDELNRLYVAGEGAEFGETVQALWQMARARETQDPAEMTRRVSDDFAAVDHRQFAFPDTNLENMQRITADDPDRSLRIVAREWLCLNSRGGVVHTDEWHVTDTGGDVVRSLIYVVTHNHTIVDRIEMFEVNDLGSAIARLDELTAKESEGQRRDSDDVEHVEWTESMLMWQRFVDAVVDGDFELVGAILSPDFHLESDRNLGVPDMDHESIVTSLSEQRELYGGSLAWEPMEVRGPDIGLVMLIWGDEGAFQLRYLVLLEMVDGLSSRGYSFDADDLDAAIAMADDWRRDGD